MAPHIHEKMDFTVEVFIVYKNKVLLRMHDKYKVWLSVGGHIELDEDPNQAAIREVKEETGLDVVLWNGSQNFFENRPGSLELVPPMGLNRHPAAPGHEHVTHIYFATSKTDTIAPQYESDRSDECRWVSKEELKDLKLWPNVEFYAGLALDKLKT